MNCSIEEIKEYLKDNLSEYRYNHSIRVMEEAKKLAIHYNCDVNKCMLCGLTHDIAKEYSDLKNEEIIKKYKISKDMLKDFSSKTIHGLIGSFVVLDNIILVLIWLWLLDIILLDILLWIYLLK